MIYSLSFLFLAAYLLLVAVLPCHDVLIPSGNINPNHLLLLEVVLVRMLYCSIRRETEAQVNASLSFSFAV